MVRAKSTVCTVSRGDSELAAARHLDGTRFRAAGPGDRQRGAARGRGLWPIRHLVRWQADRLDAVIDEIAATGYGLTLGVHSRIDETVRHILARLRVGNSYVNRSMIGAVVGAQPFGGEGLSGTGPKAGRPRYLHRFATERTVSIDTTAAGGNATLLSLQEEENEAVAS